MAPRSCATLARNMLMTKFSTTAFNQKQSFAPKESRRTRCGGTVTQGKVQFLGPISRADSVEVSFNRA